MTPALVQDMLGLASQVIVDPVSRTPLIIPIGKHRAPGDVPAPSASEQTMGTA